LCVSLLTIPQSYADNMRLYSMLRSACHSQQSCTLKHSSNTIGKEAPPAPVPTSPPPPWDRRLNDPVSPECRRLSTHRGSNRCLPRTSLSNCNFKRDASCMRIINSRYNHCFVASHVPSIEGVSIRNRADSVALSDVHQSLSFERLFDCQYRPSTKTFTFSYTGPLSWPVAILTMV
jgi:hypothetical protein